MVPVRKSARIAGKKLQIAIAAEEHRIRKHRQASNLLFFSDRAHKNAAAWQVARNAQIRRNNAQIRRNTTTPEQRALASLHRNGKYKTHTRFRWNAITGRAQVGKIPVRGMGMMSTKPGKAVWRNAMI